MSSSPIQFSSPNPAPLTWRFPIDGPGAGIVLGNGSMGLMVWGGGSTLSVSVGRNGFWDRRDGGEIEATTTYEGVRDALLAGRYDDLETLFPSPKRRTYRTPSQIPLGRVDIMLTPGWSVESTELSYLSGCLIVTLGSAVGERATLSIRQAMDEDSAVVAASADVIAAIEIVPSWRYVGDQLSAEGCQPPEIWATPGHGSMVQRLPEDDACALAWRRAAEGYLLIGVELATDPLPSLVNRMATVNAGELAARADDYWRAYRQRSPRIELPDAELQAAFDYGVHKIGGLMTPGAPAATLIGPWMQEDLFPPWSNDYHFNINVQEIYWPCFATGHWDHLNPLWDLIRSWMPKLIENGRRFFGRDIVMLPHAVDDRSRIVGHFWTGTIDVACTAWMGQMAWFHYQYSGDSTLLDDIALPLLSGAFECYWTMTEKDTDGGYFLPISVSPEYGGAGPGAWGKNASFQLAAYRMAAGLLIEAATATGIPPDQRWQDVLDNLPPYTLIDGRDPLDGTDVQRISLWDGQDLDESHRHHAHLAGIYPFGIIDPFDDANRKIVTNTLKYWLFRGAGMWSGWAIPWAASLCARCDLGDAAVTWLHWFRDIYVNDGGLSDHNGMFAGCTILNRGYILPDDANARYRDAIELDADMGAVSAITEILVQNRNGVVHVLPSLPRKWYEISFDGIWAPGGFQIGARVANRRIVEITVNAHHDGVIKLAHGLLSPQLPSVVDLTMSAGESRRFTAEEC